MTEEQVENLIEIGARSAETVLTRFITNENRFKASRGRVKFEVSEAEREGLRDYLKAWALAHRVGQ